MPQNAANNANLMRTLEPHKNMTLIFSRAGVAAPLEAAATQLAIWNLRLPHTLSPVELRMYIHIYISRFLILGHCHNCANLVAQNSFDPPLRRRFFFFLALFAGSLVSGI